MKHDINMDHEVNKMVEALDDALEEASESVLANFAERQMSDWMTAYGATEHASAEFSAMESEILRRALEVIFLRAKEKGTLW